jgi:predicted negative regulator of RcsB-dependent stress response
MKDKKEKKEKVSVKGRNGVDEAFKAASVGDRAWLFAKKNSRPLAYAALTLLTVVVAFVFGRLYSNYTTAKMTREYVSLASNDEKANFIRKYGHYKLAGLAALSLGDSFLRANNYGAAAEKYETASKILSGTVLFPRAQTSLAIALYNTNDFGRAEKLLRSVIGEKRFNASYRGNAATVLVAMLVDRKDTKKLDEFMAGLDSLDLGQNFVRAIRSQVSEK